MIINAMGRYTAVRAKAWQWTREINWVKKLSLALAMACLIGLLAQTRIPLPWTPVPITGQTFAVLLAPVLLGHIWGGVSLVLYVVLGIIWIPWFTGWNGGLAAIAGPTGGYLVGFIFSAFFLGYVIDNNVKNRNFPKLFGLMLVANFVLVFGLGLIQLYCWLNVVGQGSYSVYQVLTMGLFPFIIGDLIKVTAATAVAWAISPKK